MVIPWKHMTTTALVHVQLAHDGLNLGTNLSSAGAGSDNGNSLSSKIGVGPPLAGVPLLALEGLASGDVGVLESVETASIVKQDVGNPLGHGTSDLVLYENLPKKCVLVPSSFVYDGEEVRVFGQVATRSELGVILLDLFAV